MAEHIRHLIKPTEDISNEITKDVLYVSVSITHKMFLINKTSALLFLSMCVMCSEFTRVRLHKTPFLGTVLYELS